VERFGAGFTDPVKQTATAQFSSIDACLEQSLTPFPRQAFVRDFGRRISEWFPDFNDFPLERNNANYLPSGAVHKKTELLN
jgi:hypothetical protein